MPDKILQVPNDEELSDEELMSAYRDGSAAAFDVIYSRHKGGLYRYYLRQLNQRTEIANELFQDTWMKLINARSSYLPSAKFTTWLYHMAHNRLVDFWRSEKHIKEQLSYDDAPECRQQDAQRAEPENELQNEQLRQQIIKAISVLPEEQRSAILLKEEAALSLAEIAHVTGVNRETVKSRLRYGVKRLQGLLHPLRSIS
ncbi:hypothetical protein MNBD_GAMMA09-2943 [hydrothermal vent metagenome]|uniref:RNA polymerase ECF-type sigma factor n=1 Tax=hydrothermal vent metagenome TaxID=652676 RepID=A0A3B0Y9Q7_9ZZZZ